MPAIGIDQLKIGMITAAPVVVENRVMVAKGVAITEKIVRAFNAWGVVKVEVEGEAAEIDQHSDYHLSEEETAKVESEIDFRFGKINPKNQTMLEVKRIALNKALKRFSKS